MTIPHVAPYELPSVGDVAVPAVDWTLDPGRAALLIHDMQNYFVDAFDRDAQPMTTVLDNIVRLREICSAAGIPVIFTMLPGNQHAARQGLAEDFWGPGITTGHDTKVVSRLVPFPSDICVTKWRYSAFQRTDLRDLLHHHGRDQLIVTGVYAHTGCLLSAADAFMSDVAPFFVADATADLSREEHTMALRYVAKRCARVVTTNEAVDALAWQLSSSG